MINNPRFNYMLKEVKSRAKQREFGIEKKDYPNYKTDYKELDYSTVFILSKYAEAVIENDEEIKQDLFQDLKLVSQYFNAATSIVREHDYSVDYLLSGACAYFLLEDFGDSKALLLQLCKIDFEDDNRRLLFSILIFVFNINNPNHYPCGKEEINICNCVVDCMNTGSSFDKVLNRIKSDYIFKTLNSMQDSDIFYSQLLYAILKKIEDNSSWRLLPNLSNISIDLWNSFLKKESAPKILWTAQTIIGENNIYKGENGIIQLPTGVGKTKSIELIIRSAFLSNRANSVIIISPLRALCSEISRDMYKAFGKEIILNQLSDTLQEDYDTQSSHNKYITVCTPEKLKYILHHDITAFNNVGLFIFDEGHLFGDPNRGAQFELLITSIKEVCGARAQYVFISAVLKNADEIAKWLFKDKYNIVSSDTISTTEKNIGFVSISENEIDYYENNNYIEKNYYVKNVIKSSTLLTEHNRISTKKFPENNTKDISLYLANLLCRNGSVAIFLQNANHIESYIKRISSIKSSMDLFENISSHINITEQQKLLNLIKKHYGETSIYTSGTNIGLLPHYKNLEDGIKIAVENAIKNNFFRTIVCTSTLAQGVNIPIKYLIVTQLSAYERELNNMEVQNLIGRTARSGMYTEGSVIITDINLYNNRFEKKGYSYRSGGKFNWENGIELLNPEKQEPCKSCILNIFLPKICIRIINPCRLVIK